MRNPTNSTFPPSVTSTEYARDFRNQATGIGQALSASRRTGAVRSQLVIDAAPAAQRACRDRSYPTPHPANAPTPYERECGPELGP